MKKSRIVTHSLGGRQYRHTQSMLGVIQEMMIGGDGGTGPSGHVSHVYLQQLDITLVRDIPAFGPHFRSEIMITHSRNCP
jgi:hypothetical protein